MTETIQTLPSEHTAVITGAGGERGIGRALAQRLASQNWHLAILDVQGDGVRRLERDLSEVCSGQVLPIEVDVTEPESVETAFTEIDAKLPPVTALANLAGISSPVSLLDASPEQFQRVMDVNVTGSFLMLREAGRRMAAHGFGRIVNTSSLTAYDGGGTFSKGLYASAKAGILGLTRGGARELGPSGITVNAIAPGPVDTDIMGGTLTEDRKTAIASDIPVGRVASTEEIAAIISFLFSGEAGFINGATIQADGGKHMH